MIYVITYGRYSDYHICAVATSKKRAEELQRFYSDKYDEARIEEFMENAPNIENSIREHYYQVCFRADGELNRDYFKEYWDRLNLPLQFKFSLHYDNHLTIMNISAENEEAAIKIARERRAQYLIEKYHLN